jgi:hypothetical protein
MQTYGELFFHIITIVKSWSTFIAHVMTFNESLLYIS